MTTAGAWRRLRRLAPVALVLVAPACVYFNGIYNAREAQRMADKRARSGREADAAVLYATMATKAESVLARFPKSKWRGEALYLAGRGHAWGGRCREALPRLGEYLALPATDATRRTRATLALATCFVRLDRYSDGLALLDTLTRARDASIAKPAALWAARAAIALGDNASAQRYLANLDAAAAEWELAAASMERGEVARAESLLAIRAGRGDWREDAEARLTDLWLAGEREAVERLVNRFDAAHTSSSGRARAHLLAARLQMGEQEPRLDSLARVHLMQAMRATTDTAIDREATVRLAQLSLRTAPGIEDVDSILQRVGEEAKGSQLQLRLSDARSLVRILLGTRDPTGAATYLAAETARDSLEAVAYARTLYRQVSESYPTSPLAPRALLAAATLWPDSAEAFHQRIRDRFPMSPYASVLETGELGRLPGHEQAERALRDAWRAAVKIFSDSVVARRAPAAGSRPPTTASTPP